MGKSTASPVDGAARGLVLLLLVCPLCLLWRPLFAGQAFFWGTPLLQFVPWQRMAAEMWRGGHLPLWNPLVGCGAPLAANYQTAAFYPLNVLYLLIPAEVALSWTTALHLVLAGWGMYRWGRAVELDWFPALLGALALQGSGFLVARVALFPSVVLAFSWMGVWLWRAEVLVQRSRLYDALCLGLSLGLGLLAGHAQTVFYGGLMLVAYLAFRVRQEAAGQIKSVVHLVQLVALAFVLGVGLAAVQLLPTAELLMLSQRSTSVDYDAAMTYSLWPWRLITFAAPDFFGNPGRGDYWGYPNYWEGAGYMGVLPLLLAVEAVLGWKRAGQRARSSGIWFWVFVTAIALVLALGQYTPVFPFLFRHVPTFSLFQAPARWLALTTVALAALSALGARQWPCGRRGQRRGRLAAVVGMALLLGGLAAPRLARGVSATFGPATARLGLFLAVAGVLALLRRDRPWWRAAVVGFVAFDLLLFGWPLVPTVDRSLYHESTATAMWLEDEPGPTARVYWPVDPKQPNSDYGAEYRVKFGYLAFDSFGPQDTEHWWQMREALLPNVGMLDGVLAVSNFDPLLVGRYVDLLQAAVESRSLLQVMGATHVISDRPWVNGETVQDSKTATGEGLEPVVTLYRLPAALGRAWVVPAARIVSSEEALTALVDSAFDPAAEVLLELSSGDQQPVPSTHSSPISIEYRVALHDAPNGVKMHVYVDVPGYLVVADTWYPGWQAKVNGEPVDILRANYGFRAIWLGAGKHLVEMAYRPVTVSVGAVISLASLASLAAGMLLKRRQEDLE
jgi:hypothetical protein